ncbi:hypothetical protein BDY24DRAFT_134064 [Mrakia frigida]|uniref:uncharacterized protein n=1 Tax=Mrakia frigida TaxID=29902 RepID=UPI003FCC11F9
MSSSPSYHLPRSPRSYDLSFDASSASVSPSSSSVSISLYRNESHDSTTSSSTFSTNGPTTPPPTYAFPASQYQHSLPSYSERAAFISLRSSTSEKHPQQRSISLALTAQVEEEIAAREQRRREVQIRAKLEPLLFPAPKPFGKVVKGLFGAGKREKVTERKRCEAEGAKLTGEEVEVGKKMIDEYFAG